MPVQFVTSISGRFRDRYSPAGDADPIGYVRHWAQLHERAGYDLLLIGFSSDSGDNLAAAQYACTVTDRLRYVVAHRPGFVSPTLAARMFATVDHYTQGRIVFHCVTGGSDSELQRDGDWLEHDERYARTDEFLSIVRRVWTDRDPFDHDGRYYQVRQATSIIRPYQQPHPPIFFGGASPAAFAVGPRHADVYVTHAGPIADVSRRRDQILASAAEHGRRPRVAMSLKAILGPTEAAAWERAFAIRDRTAGMTAAGMWTQAAAHAQMRALAEQDIHDARLWTGITRSLGGGGAFGDATCLVGTPDQIVESLLAYYDAGIDTFFIGGFEQDRDPEELGREVFPAMRAHTKNRVPRTKNRVEKGSR